MTKKILSVALAVLMLLIVAFPVNAAVEVTNVKVRGLVIDNNTAGPIPVWDYQNFAGFYYDLKYNRSTETLKLNGSVSDYSGRTIDKTELTYETKGVPVDFKVYEKETSDVSNSATWVKVDGDSSYNLVGWQAEKWIAIKGVSNKIAKLAFEMEKEDKKTLTTGETWSLGSGYELNINAIDARTTPRQVWFTLKKDGAIIDEGIGQAPTENSGEAKTKAVYFKKKTILGESDALLFTVYVDTIFSGATSDMVQFKYAWLIDESSAKEIKSADRYGVFEVREAGSALIRMDNENSVSLSKNTEVTLMGNLKLSVADNDTLRFYPFVEYTTPGTYEVRGTVVDINSTIPPSWNAQNFAGFYYDIKYNRSTETMALDGITSDYSGRTIDKTKLTYETKGVPVEFKVYEKETSNVSNSATWVRVDGDSTYNLVGWQAEKWIAVKGVSNKIAKLAFEMDKEDKKTLTTGETWSLGSGYELNINAIDARTTPRQVWFTLKKDGAIIDEGIGQAPTENSGEAKTKAVYFKKKTILGESDALLFTVYVDTIFSGATSDMVQFKYAWLIDESSAKEIKSADRYGVFEVREAGSALIRMDNENSISLSKNTETTLMGELKFKVADNNTLRFYPKVDYVITEGGNVTPTVTGTAPRGTPGVTVTGTATATFTTARPTEAATPLGTVTPPKPPVTTTTVPGFEAMFAVAGLLAVAYLVLRKRK